MANEITVLEGNSANRYDLLFLYDIPVPVQISGGNTSPSNTDFLRASTDLPTPAQVILSAPELTAIDNGTLGWEVIFGFQKQPGLTNPQLIQMVQEIYGIAKIAFGLEYDLVMQHIGVRLNE